MTSWLDFEVRFRECAKKLPHLRLDIQGGAAGEHFHLTGDERGTDYRHLSSVVMICGRMLDRALPKGSKILEEENYTLRWYRLLQEVSGACEPEMLGSLTRDDGTNAGTISLGRIQRFCEESASLCMRLEASHPIRDDRSFGSRLYDDYGKELIIGSILVVLAAVVGLFFGGK